MKTIHHILGMLWIVIFAYLCISSGLTIYHIIPDFHIVSMVLLSFFTLLYLGGAVASLYVLRGSRLGRVVVAVVALFSAIACIVGFFAFLNFPPFSPVGIAFDIFALISFGVLLIPGKYAMA